MLFLQEAAASAKTSSSVQFLTHGALEVFTGLLWIAVGFLVERLIKLIKAKQIEKKFPLSGTYLTTYTDKDVPYKDMVHLKQRGAKITGSSVPNPETPNGSRTWLFEGDIRDRGYMLGGYRPESPFDKGFGAYFLKLNRDGDMNGYWLGNDSEEKDIVFGTYRFLKQPPYEIVPIGVSDITQVLQIAEQQLGDAYIDSTTLKMSGRSVAFCAKVGGCVVGFGTGQMMSSEEFKKRVEARISADVHSIRPLLRRLEDHQEIGFIASAAVKPACMGRGLGAELIGHCINALEQLGADVLISTAWRSKIGVQAGGILECRGFQQLLEIPNYWEKDSMEHGYKCPTCGNPPCHCSAVVYVRNRHYHPRPRK